MTSALRPSSPDPLVLLCEDEPVDAQRVRRSLRADPSGARLRLLHETTLGAGLERLAERRVDVVLLDLHLPDSDGIDTVRRLRARDPSVPLVVFTTASDDETAVAALAAGAQDYLVKEEIGAALLCRSIRYAIERRRIAEENRLLEQRLRDVEKLESLGTLCAGITFGFNTQLGTILDHCSEALAAADPRTRPVVRSSLLGIHRAATRAAEMVERLRDYSALERKAGGEVDLARFVIDIADFLGAMVAPEIDVAYEATRMPLRVEVERRELQRMLVSLVVNAAEAIGGGSGSISISTGALDADAGLLAGSFGWPEPRPGPYAYLRVADTGGGLDATRPVERIFDPFYTTKYAGRGLGLASVLGILHRRSGVVRVDPNRPTGTVFTVLLPRPEPPVPAAH